MRIPPAGKGKRERLERLTFYETIRQRCMVSRSERRDYYDQWRLYWMYGTDGSYVNEDDETGKGPPPGNKLWPHLDQLSSFLYSQDTTRFSVELASGVNKEFQKWVDPLDQYVNDNWHASNMDITFGLGLLYALVFGSTFIKQLWRKDGIYPSIVMPHNFGVLREDIAGLSKQEAFVHFYTTTESQFRNDFSWLKNLDDVVKNLTPRGEGAIDLMEGGVDRIIMSGQDPLDGDGSGRVDWLTQVQMCYLPRVREPLLEMSELFIYDDDLKDWRIVTMAGDLPVIDRALKMTGGIEHTIPFQQICPNPDPGYFFGQGEVERLIPLQTQRNRIMAQIDHINEIQAHPPSTASGFPGDLLEMQYTLDTPGGFMNQPDLASAGGQPKAERIKIEVPQNLYDRLDRNDAMFEDMSGLPAITQGKAVSGVRSGGHANELAKLGSSRAKKRALIVEDNIEDVASYGLRLHQKYDDKQLEVEVQGKDGKPETLKFVADQFTDDYVVKVDSHSNSQIFSEDTKQEAMALLKAKAITRKRFLQMMAPPNVRQLIWDLENIIEPGEARAAQQQMALERERIEKGGAGRPGKPNTASQHASKP